MPMPCNYKPLCYLMDGVCVGKMNVPELDAAEGHTAVGTLCPREQVRWWMSCVLDHNENTFGIVLMLYNMTSTCWPLSLEGTWFMEGKKFEIIQRKFWRWFLIVHNWSYKQLGSSPPSPNSPSLSMYYKGPRQTGKASEADGQLWY